jgi:hypothetical protein
LPLSDLQKKMGFAEQINPAAADLVGKLLDDIIANVRYPPPLD